MFRLLRLKPPYSVNLVSSRNHYRPFFTSMKDILKPPKKEDSNDGKPEIIDMKKQQAEEESTVSSMTANEINMFAESKFPKNGSMLNVVGRFFIRILGRNMINFMEKESKAMENIVGSVLVSLETDSRVQGLLGTPIVVDPNRSSDVTPYKGGLPSVRSAFVVLYVKGPKDSGAAKFQTSNSVILKLNAEINSEYIENINVIPKGTKKVIEINSIPLEREIDK